ncbi:VTT domain-containing protein [Nocardiopsis coralliicola]
MGEILLAFAAGAVSGLVPVLNIEVYLLGAAVITDDAALVATALSAAAGQTAGKLAYYAVGRGALDVSWLRRQSERPAGKWRERAARWREQGEARPVWSAGLLASSSLISIPPLMVVCVLAGAVRMPVWVFTAVTAATRFLRFLAIVYLPGLAAALGGTLPG